MKKIKIYMMFLAVFALFFTSCSKDEEAVNESDKLGSLSFTTVLNDLVANKASLKQQLDIPACSDDAPVFVAVVLSGETNVGTVDSPVIVSVNPNPDNFDDDEEDEYFTDESSELELVPGQYTLEYFVVYNGDPSEDGTEVIWVAPRVDGELSSFVDTPLPLTFDLGPGAKKYVDVEVLCFDDRMVNEYGYLFFDLETTRAIEFCVFGNFCDDNGRHFPAAFNLSIWEFANGIQGDIIHENVANTVTQNADGDFSASTVCLALPDTSGDDMFWVEITLMDSDAYDTETRVIRSGILTEAEIKALFDGEDNVEYYHFREGNCDSGDVPELFDDEETPTEDSDNDGVVNADDNCPTTPNPNQEDEDGDGIGDVCDACPTDNPTTDMDGDGCEDEATDLDSDGDGIPDSTDACPNENPTTDEDGDGCEDEVTDEDTDGDGIPDSVDACPNDNPTTDEDGDGCEDEVTDQDSDGDGIPDAIDACPNENPTTDEDGDGCEDEVTDQDSDGDGIPDAVDACPNENPTTDEDGDGCEDEAACEITAPATGCDVALLEGVTGFVSVTDNFPLDIMVDGESIGSVGVDIAGGTVTVTSNLTVMSNAQYTDYEIEVSANSNGAGAVTVCGGLADPSGALSVNIAGAATSYPFYVRLKANVCPAN